MFYLLRCVMKKYLKLFSLLLILGRIVSFGILFLTGEASIKECSYDHIGYRNTLVEKCGVHPTDDTLTSCVDWVGEYVQCIR